MGRINFPTFVSALALLLPLAGCGMMNRMTAAKGTFTVAVTNQSTVPIRIGLAKTGPPFEDSWSTPEDVAIFEARNPNAHWGQLVLPGQTGTIPERSGRFYDNVYATVRVYANDPSLTDMLAMGRHSPDRLDIPLVDGVNRFVITDDGKTLAFKRLPQPPPTNAEAVAR